MKTSGRGAARPMRWVAGSLLMLSSSAAMALGLGQIQVMSRPGQPLLAEIPIISNVAGELDGATARLAPPDVFARVGLEPPQGVVVGLQFDIVPNAQGRMVVRVTSSEPVSAQALSFLVEVDWGKGRLVREYSALVDAPQTAAALAEPQIQAPTAAPADRSQRPSPAASGALPPAVAESAPAWPVATSPRAGASAIGPAARASAGASEWTVERGQVLSQIARRLDDGEATLDQTMMALLHVNPQAFIGGNVNRLRAGAVLRIPGHDERVGRTAREASALVREQIAQWRQARSRVMQPAEPAGVAVKTDASAAPVRQAQAANKAPSSARLEIAPAASGAGRKAGNQSGIAAGGKGDTLMNEQLQQAKEDLASRDAQIQDLRSRVAELEKLQQDQQKLIALKDNELAAAQKRLAGTAAATPSPAAAVPAKTTRPVPPAAAPETSATPAWWWAGLGVLLLGLIGVWLRRRREAAAVGDELLKPHEEDLAQPPIDDEEDVSPVGVNESIAAADLDAREPHEASGAEDARWTKPDVASPATDAAGAHRFDWLADGAASADSLPGAGNPAMPFAETAGPASGTGMPAQTSAMPVDVVPGPEEASFDIAPETTGDAGFADEAVLSYEPVHEQAPESASATETPAKEGGEDVAAITPPSVPESAATDVASPSGGNAGPPPSSAADAGAAGVGDGLGDRERLDLAIAYLDMGDTETAREMLEEAKASRDPQVRGEAEQLLREIG